MPTRRRRPPPRARQGRIEHAGSAPLRLSARARKAATACLRSWRNARGHGEALAGMEKRLPFQGAPRSSTEKRARLSRSAGGRGGALAPSRGSKVDRVLHPQRHPVRVHLSGGGSGGVTERPGRRARARMNACVRVRVCDVCVCVRDVCVRAQVSARRCTRACLRARACVRSRMRSRVQQRFFACAKRCRHVATHFRGGNVPPLHSFLFAAFNAEGAGRAGSPRTPRRAQRWPYGSAP